MNIKNLIGISMVFVSALAWADGTYQVPVKDARLASHATFAIKVTAQGENSIKLTLPTDLVGDEIYEMSFQLVKAEDGLLVYECDNSLQFSKKNTLRCSVAQNEAVTVCLASWPKMTGHFDERSLRGTILRRHPQITEQALSDKIAVARSFSGDGIGILTY